MATQGTNNNTLLRTIIIGIVVIIAIGLVLSFGLGFGFKFYNSWLQYGQPKIVEAQEKVVVEATEAKVDNTKTAETAVAEEATVETVVKTSEKAPFIPEGQIPVYASSIDGRPENGTELYSDVGYDEIWCATFGPGEFLGVIFPGGEKTGTVVIQLGPTKVGGDKTHYVITNLLPGCGWQGNWHYNQRLVTEKDWMAIKDLKVKEMMGPDNATDSLGCNTVIVVVAQAGKIIFQETCYRQ